MTIVAAAAAGVRPAQSAGEHFFVFIFTALTLHPQAPAALAVRYIARGAPNMNSRQGMTAPPTPELWSMAK